MKTVLLFIVGLLISFIVQLIGAGFFWLLSGGKSSLMNEFDKGFLFRNEIVGVIIVVTIGALIFEIIQGFNLL